MYLLSWHPLPDSWLTTSPALPTGRPLDSVSSRMAHALSSISVVGVCFGGRFCPYFFTPTFPFCVSFPLSGLSHLPRLGLTPSCFSPTPVGCRDSCGKSKTWLISLLPSTSSCNFADLLTKYFFSYFDTSLHPNITKPLSVILPCLTFTSLSSLLSPFLLELSPSQISPVLSNLQIFHVFCSLSISKHSSSFLLIQRGTLVFLL